MARTLIGTVSSKKTDKTIVITVQTSKTHPIYKKQYSVSRRFMAHDEKNEANKGDKVQVVECRPLSANKRYKLAKILERPEISEDQSVEAITAEEKPVEPKEEK